MEIRFVGLVSSDINEVLHHYRNEYPHGDEDMRGEITRCGPIASSNRMVVRVDNKKTICDINIDDEHICGAIYGCLQTWLWTL